MDVCYNVMIHYNCRRIELKVLIDCLQNLIQDNLSELASSLGKGASSDSLKRGVDSNVARKLPTTLKSGTREIMYSRGSGSSSSNSNIGNSAASSKPTQKSKVSFDLVVNSYRSSASLIVISMIISCK